MKEEKSEYDIKSEDFLSKTGTEFKAEFIKNDLYFPDDKEPRDIYLITLKRGDREYKFKFGNSINASGNYLYFGNVGDYKRGDRIRDEAILKKLRNLLKSLKKVHLIMNLKQHLYLNC